MNKQYDMPLVVSGIVKIHVRSDGYDKNGNYWGAGMPVFMFDLAFEHNPSHRYFGDDCVRARTRKDAIAQIRKRHNIARIVR